jgi:hypothetical protein
MSVQPTTFFGILLALISIPNAYVCASIHTAAVHPPRNSTNAGSVHDSRSLEVYECSARPVTEDEVRAAAASVAQFYQRVQRSGDTSWQKTIEIDVNFVIIDSTDGQGIKQAQAVAQVDVLNNLLSPEFSFNLKYLQVVTNNGYRNLDLEADSALVKEMRASTRKGGMEMLNVWTTSLRGGGLAEFSYPQESAGSDDGIVMGEFAVPGGGNAYFSQGKVGIERASPELPHSSRVPMLTHFCFVGLLPLSIGLASSPCIWSLDGSFSYVPEWVQF